MNKKTTSSFLIILSFFIYSCGFTPQYAGFKNLEFDLVIDQINGDRDFNNEIKSQIKRYDRDRKDIEKIKISYESNYEKVILSKNTKGEATKYNLTVNVIFDIKSESYSTKIEFNDEFSIDKIDDTIEENNYIKIVKRNFAERAIEKLILSIRQNK
tara:strand:+ start:1077 stop:1544 length:468 start_codon:yes stop_codon:yes gene_type:complete